MYKFILLSLFFIFPHGVSAAVISFDPQETTVGLNTPFLVGVTIDADTRVNAISLVIDIPDNTEVVEASDGNSIINIWVERPHITDGHQIVFSGIIPGGFSGVRGKLITLKMQTKKEGKISLALSPTTRVYEDTADAQSQSIISSKLDLTAVSGKDNLINRIPDTAAPEPFVPVIVSIQDNGGGALWTVSFQTQDKGSGVERYAVAESSRTIDLSQNKYLEELSWKEVHAPYILSDQRLSSYVYIRAIDYVGNIRYSRLDPQRVYPWWEHPGSYIILILCVVVLMYHVLSKKFTINIKRK
jgi:hypothetical protein